MNDQELPTVGSLLGLKGPADAFGPVLVRQFSLRLLAVTRGGSGSTLFTPGGRLDHPGFPAQVVDTVGAGDAFGAVLAIGLVQGLDLIRVHAHANRVAAFVCGQAGATPALPGDLARI